MLGATTRGVFLSKNVSWNEKRIASTFSRCDDVFFRRFEIGDSKQRALLVFLTNLVEKAIIDTVILRSLMDNHNKRRLSIQQIQAKLIPSSEIRLLETFTQVESAIAAGEAVLFIDGHPQALSIAALKWEHRAVEKADNEVTVRGPQQAFSENMMNNIALVRRFIFDAKLKVEKGTIGTVTKTPYCLVYHDEFIDKAIVEEVRNRLGRLDLDQVLDTGVIEQLISDSPWSPFPTVDYTERPDRLVSQILQGRVAIFLENSPQTLTVPALFVEFLQVPEDYYQGGLLQSSIRILRYFAFLVSFILPSLYVAIMGYNHELIPNTFLPSVLEQRDGLPVPTAMEVIIMDIAFEVLREAGLRFPRPIGQAISIVGALVIGQAAVQARLVMAATVIVIATTGICSFTVPGYTLSAGARLLRFPLLIVTSFLGLLGFSLGLLVIAAHFLTLRSFGVIYTAGLAPRARRDLQDTVLRGRLPTQSRTPWIGRKRPK